MKRKLTSWLTLAAVSAIIFAGIASAQENIGQTKQGLVNGQPVSAEAQERYGLLTLTTPTSGCSASLLTNEWVITAAHCLRPADLSNPSQVRLTANWKTVQSRSGAQIRSFGTPDIALIRVASPFRVFGSTEGYQRRLLDGDELMNRSIMTFGRGINVLAQGSGPTATPTQNDGQYRFAETRITKFEQNLYWFPRNGFNQIVAGGDSGGPSLTNIWSGEVLVGVHSKCTTRCLPGRMCGPPSPWTWVSEIPECADAAVAPITAEILRTIRKDASPPPSTPPPPFDGRFPSTPPPTSNSRPAANAPSGVWAGTWVDKNDVSNSRIIVQVMNPPSVRIGLGGIQTRSCAVSAQPSYNVSVKELAAPVSGSIQFQQNANCVIPLQKPKVETSVRDVSRLTTRPKLQDGVTVRPKSQSGVIVRPNSEAVVEKSSSSPISTALATHVIEVAPNVTLELYEAYSGRSHVGYRIRYLRKADNGSVIKDVILVPAGTPIR